VADVVDAIVIGTLLDSEDDNVDGSFEMLSESTGLLMETSL
jgi:hypothetical protein